MLDKILSPRTEGVYISSSCDRADTKQLGHPSLFLRRNGTSREYVSRFGGALDFSYVL